MEIQEGKIFYGRSNYFKYPISGEDFTRAGEASSDVKRKLKQMGVNPEAIRKVAIAMYEGEINMVIHADGGEITVEITPEKIDMILDDKGPGIKDVELAMQAGYSTAPDEIRSLGFGAGMGLPNMKNIQTRWRSIPGSEREQRSP